MNIWWILAGLRLRDFERIQSKKKKIQVNEFKWQAGTLFDEEEEEDEERRNSMQKILLSSFVVAVQSMDVCSRFDQ